MGHAQRRKGNTAKHKQIGKSRKTKRYQRDIDQIVNDLQPQNIIKFNNLEVDEDLPGLGQFYCVFCAKYFINKNYQRFIGFIFFLIGCYFLFFLFSFVFSIYVSFFNLINININIISIK